jgi:hypothetical protein
MTSIFLRENFKIFRSSFFEIKNLLFHLTMAPPLKSVNEPCCEDANNILNTSQGVPSHLQQLRGLAVGHPRYHVLCRKGINAVEILEDLPSLGCTEIVTEHLRNTKSAFRSREEQNEALHRILMTDYGRHAINQLERGRDEIVLRSAMRNLMPNLLMTRVAHGNRIETDVPVISCLLILGHHVGKQEGTYVHVKTFYPTDREIAGEYQIE